MCGLFEQLFHRCLFDQLAWNAAVPLRDGAVCLRCHRGHESTSRRRQDYGEQRTITFGLLHGRMVALVWTPRGAARRIISMRYANEREVARHRTLLGGPR
ncbi:BrnT family toxin [Azohydromonas caseinilytica]|uniref:BrnT family toxin n=1 Tax=Azohydromonas caseinilytica TaxID=2728836 RepID=A0A848FBW9_9BURK|nr:BrnT family toxin [Azohydromonas caseinilytica]